MFNFDSADKLTFNEIGKLYKEYSNLKLPDLYSKFSFGKEIFFKSKGSFLHTKDNKKVFDFTGGLGVANMGHNHDRILEVRRKFNEQDYTEIHKNYLNRFLAAASFNLANILPGDLNYSFFCNSGAEAVDGALKISYKYHNGDRPFVLKSDRSFHGKTIGAGSLSTGDNFIAGKARFSFQQIPGVKTYNFNSFESIQEIVKNSQEGIYAIFVEPYSCSTLTESRKDFLTSVRNLCNEKDILLVFDEIYSGFAKCGYNFYMEKYNIIPDIVCLSKALGGGKSSISAYVTNSKVYKRAYGSLSGSLMHSTTYNSFGEECVTAMEACNILIDEKLANKSKELEKILRFELNQIKENNEFIKFVRGAGTHFGVNFQSSLEYLKPLFKFIPISFVQDPNFINKLVTTAIIEKYYSDFNTLCAFTSNRDVILNFSPSPISDPDEVRRRLIDFGKMIKGGIFNIIQEFIRKNLI